ncbi:MAG: alpha-2-macroglobulin family protein [Akkermansia sp.]|nr:alpha-2-macroglobulin family protein [Akkermansia sp.]
MIRRFAILFTFFYICGFGVCAPNTTTDDASKTISSYIDKEQFKKASELALKHLQTQDNEESGKILALYIRALDFLNQLDSDIYTDDIIAEQLKHHGENPEFLISLAGIYNNISHRFELEDGKYIRTRRYRGDFSGEARDKIQSIQHLLKAISICKKSNNNKTLASAYLILANIIQNSSQYNNFAAYASLASLTDYSKLPPIVPLNEAYESAHAFRNVETLPIVNPGTKQQEILFYPIPDSWETAKNDGQRLRWLWQAARKANPELESRLVSDEIAWANRFFSYALLARRSEPIYGPGNAGSVAGIDPSTLSTEQTVVEMNRAAKDKDRYRIITLPNDNNIFALFEKMPAPTHDDFHHYFQSASLVLNEYIQRNQRQEAADFLKKIKPVCTKLLESTKDKKISEKLNDQLWQINATLAYILEPNGEFVDDNRVLLANDQISIQFQYRNATSATISMQELDIRKWAETRENKLKNWSKKINKLFDTYPFTPSQLFSDITENNYKEYLGKKIDGGKISLNPGNKHLDQISDIALPTQKAGWYILTITLENGYKFHRLITLQDMVLVRRYVPEGCMWFVADAKTGAPVNDAKISIFKYNYNNYKKHITGTTDADGVFIEKEEKKTNQPYRFTDILVTKGDSYLVNGNNHRLYDSNSFINKNKNVKDEAQLIFLGSQPVYRPGQKVQLRGIVYHADYANPTTVSCANRQFIIQFSSPTGDKTTVPEQVITTDEVGGFNLDFTLPTECPLGAYSVKFKPVDKRFDWRYTSGFRVEEYKKPEFTVSVKAPQKEVRLGKDIPITIQANYYAGGPVSQGKATISITRNLETESWRPPHPWGGFYERISIHSATDSIHNPGADDYQFKGRIPRPWQESDRPLTWEQTIPLDKNGQATINYSTLQDAKDFPTHNIAYSIQVKVVDASLREISESASVIAACKPFEVFTSLNYGFAQTGVPVQATITAATANGTKIKQAKGQVTLYHILGHHKPENLGTWDIVTDDNGNAVINFQTKNRGLHRLAIVFPGTEGNSPVYSSFDFLSYGEKSKFDGFYTYKPLAITTDKHEYAAGETAKIIISSNYENSSVWTFCRSSWSNESRQLVKLDGQLGHINCRLEKTDIPNFAVNAFTVHRGQLLGASTMIFMPPQNQKLNSSIQSNYPNYQPNDKGQLTLKVTSSDGKPVKNSFVTLAVYDKSLEDLGGTPPNLFNRIWYDHNSTSSKAVRMIQMFNNRQLAHNEYSFVSLLHHSSIFIPIPECQDVLVNGMDAFGAAPMPTMAMAKRSALRSMKNSVQDDEYETEDECDEAAMAPALGAETGATQKQNIAIRKNFADSLKWIGCLKTDDNGVATIPMEMPENLTTWMARAWMITPELQIGECSTEFLTSKDLMVSMQAPRFFVEKDLVMLTAIVRNQTDKPLSANVALTLENDCLELLPAGSALLNQVAPNESNAASKSVSIPAKSLVAVNWWTRALHEGSAIVTMSAKGEQLSDAMQMNFPVLVHGMMQLHTDSTVLTPNTKVGNLNINLPQQRRADSGELIVKISPSIALSMVEALPFLAEYPYGCVEQTLNRFVPACEIINTLNKLGISPTKVLESAQSLNPQTIKDKAFYDANMARIKRNPVYSEKKIHELVAKGIAKLKKMQHSNGGWSWFDGGDYTCPVMTANVLHGLGLVGDSFDVPKSMLQRANNWLTNYQNQQIKLLEKGDKYREIIKIKDEKERKKALNKLGEYRLNTYSTDAWIHYVLTERKSANAKMTKYLLRDKLGLPMLSKIHLAEILLITKQNKELEELMPIITQFVKEDKSLQTAHLNLRNENYWWFWYGNNNATQAAFLHLMCKYAPKDELNAKLAKWLLNNRRNGSYWDSTKDTADCLEALSLYLLTTKEGMSDMEAEILYDGEVVKTIKCTKDTLFTYDNAFVLTGKNLTTGKHNITIRRLKGDGNIYANSNLSYFSLEDHIPPAGNAVTVERSCYVIKTKAEKDDAILDTQTDAGELISQGQDRTTRRLIKDGDIIQSGDIIEVVLSVKTKNDVEYIMLRDPKPAGCESTQTNSGYTSLGTAFGYKEIADTEIRLFLEKLSMGEYQLKHTLRAERPGKFSSLPTVIEAMYAPELRGNSSELKLGIEAPKN